MQGKIIKGIAGFYYVHIPEHGVFECKAKGVFRKDHVKPLVGDNVNLSIINEVDKIGNIVEILPRKNALIRPAVANVDQALIIFSIVKPEPNFNLLDRFLIMMQQQNVPCLICFNKSDLDGSNIAKEYCEAYKDSGCQIHIVSTKNGDGIEELLAVLAGKTSTVAGPSGVGKSSIINCLQTEIEMETNSISERIERGKHTTRHSEMIAINKNSYILDTPGFSSLELFDLEKEELSVHYAEFGQHELQCKFAGCSHINEPICGVKSALQEGAISNLRYENYKTLYEVLKNQKKKY